MWWGRWVGHSRHCQRRHFSLIHLLSLTLSLSFALSHSLSLSHSLLRSLSHSHSCILRAYLIVARHKTLALVLLHSAPHPLSLAASFLGRYAVQSPLSRSNSDRMSRLEADGSDLEASSTEAKAGPPQFPIINRFDTCIAEGTFARIYTCPYTKQIVYKVCINPGASETVTHEAKICDELRMFTMDTRQWSFRSPNLHRVYKPTVAQLHERVTLEKILGPAPNLQLNDTHHPALILDRIPPVPLPTAHSFYHHILRRTVPAPNILSIRLLFGVVSCTDTTALSDGPLVDVPLDAVQYTHLPFVPPIEDVAKGMGHILARMHWGVGIDARGVELILGGCHEDASRPQCWVLDFDKCERWLVYRPLEYLHWVQLTCGSFVYDSLPSGARRLANIISREPFYPLPRDVELYNPFKKAYIDEVDRLLEIALKSYGQDRLFKAVKTDGYWTWLPHIRAAVHAFFDELEKIDAANVKHSAETAQQASIARISLYWQDKQQAC
ncbi:hypothetical protein CC85DRAFT_649 [Cutaneotrichosporon oleaginosum]|uniref:DUF3669 domain-containing protein n=1 Tax=Cutaneotrichosporon oleaginosum TaxID=879819 RepID=A0A0J0XZ80_9TREE|nr:uncharacterized protein CC85DRAFT_649 [Cutaneotrichosporon oleaginosum]KLT46358.1 hypothetical protein CC85DRAFT_649 [Cutaneotrichosporon oleaginosum]TXT15271.1 hypothetical protein COLE_01464 [Cutaneotrichosporon oleaginosum]